MGNKQRGIREEALVCGTNKGGGTKKRTAAAKEQDGKNCGIKKEENGKKNIQKETAGKRAVSKHEESSKKDSQKRKAAAAATTKETNTKKAETLTKMDAKEMKAKKKKEHK